MVTRTGVAKEKELEDKIKKSYGHMKHVDSKLARKVAISVVATTKEYSWIDPYLLLGLAANETDLRSWKRGGPGDWDCGITQNRVTIWGLNRNKKERLCVSLLENPKKSFLLAAKELERYRKKYCSKKSGWRFWRCILNMYNQGPKYRRVEKCKTKRCRIISRYWLRVLCFAKAFFNGEKPQKCRSVYKRKQFTGLSFL